MIFKIPLSRLVELAELNIAEIKAIRKFSIEKEEERIKELVVEYNNYIDPLIIELTKPISFIQKIKDFFNSEEYYNPFKKKEVKLPKKITFEEIVPTIGLPPKNHEDFEAFLKKRQVETRYDMFYDLITGYHATNKYYYGDGELQYALDFLKSAYTYPTTTWEETDISITEIELRKLTKDLSIPRI